MLRPLYQLSGWLGLTVVAALAALASWAAGNPTIAKLGLSPLTLAIVFGIALGNSFFPRWGHLCGDGVDFAKNVLLRAGIVLYGFRITLQQVFGVGWQGLAVDLIVVFSIFSLAIIIGRWLRVDRETAILIGAGSSICGAAAVMATEPVLKASPAKVSVAIATVVLFGTLSMFLYPFLQGPFGLSDRAYGFFVGSTVHEVAQVVAAGKAVSEEAATVAVIVKMLRVMMLAPFLLIVSLLWGKRPATIETTDDRESAVSTPVSIRIRLKHVDIPWFAVAFLLTTGIYSAGVVPPAAVAWLVKVDTIFLAMAMGALGLRTHTSALRAAGPRPLLLAASLLVVLVVGGSLLTKQIGQL
jgi:uncharacterized integral membrane protein (TIGR00698 family)